MHQNSATKYKKLLLCTLFYSFFTLDSNPYFLQIFLAINPPTIGCLQISGLLNVFSVIVFFVILLVLVGVVD